MTQVIDPLFVGATRPSLVWGVTYEAIILSVSIVGLLFLATNNPFLMVLYAPMHGACYLICLKDPRFFRLIMLWSTTKCKSFGLGWNRWGAATTNPFTSTRKHRIMPQ